MPKEPAPGILSFVVATCCVLCCVVLCCVSQVVGRTNVGGLDQDARQFFGHDFVRPAPKLATRFLMTLMASSPMHGLLYDRNKELAILL